MLTLSGHGGLRRGRGVFLIVAGWPARQVEQAVDQVISHVGRALGATPFCRNSHFARLSADLPVYLRQSHAERDLQVLGKLAALQPDTRWPL